MQCEVSSKSVNLYHPTLCWIFYFCLFCWDSTSPFVHSHISVWPYFSPTLEWAPDTPITWVKQKGKSSLDFQYKYRQWKHCFSFSKLHAFFQGLHSSILPHLPFTVSFCSHHMLAIWHIRALQRCLSSCWSNQLWNWKQHSCFCAALHLGSVLFLSSAAGITQHFSSQFGHAVPELDASLRYKAVWVLHSRS